MCSVDESVISLKIVGISVYLYVHDTISTEDHVSTEIMSVNFFPKNVAK